MSITKRQVEKLISKLTISQLQKGNILNLDKIEEMLREVIGENQGYPTLRYKNQERKEVFDVDHYNDFFNKFEFDIETAYEEISEIIYNSLLKINTFELSYRAQSQQLNQIIAQLDNFLFTINNANGNFYGVFDNFSSTSKIDLNKSTAKVLDLQEECLSLPSNMATGKKIDMKHMYQKGSWPINVVAENLVSSQNSIASNFGNAFSDIYSPWRYEVITSSPGPVTIEFDIPLSPTGKQNFSTLFGTDSSETSPSSFFGTGSRPSNISRDITRLQVIPHSSNNMVLNTRYTVDDINFIVFPNTKEDTVLKQESRTYNFDFTSTQAEKVRFIVTKEDYDEEDQNGNFIYYFGFKHIGFYTLGTAYEAQYISKPLKPAGIEKSIDSVSIMASDQIPAYTNVEYFVSLADSFGEQIGDWQLIAPINKNNNFAGKRTIEFRSNGFKTRQIHAEESLAKYETHRGIDFYKLPVGIDSGDNNIFGSSELYRGYNLWNKNINEDVVLRQVKDSYISFNPGDVQDIYAVVTETAAVDSGTQTFPGGGVSNTMVTKFTVSKPINYSIQTMSLVPDPDINSIVDQRPNYAIYEIKRFGSNMNITGEIINLTGLTTASFANTVISNTLEEPVITNTSDNYAYIRDVDYVIVESADGTLNRIRRTANSNIADGENVAAAYSINPNITQQVDGIRDNVIYMNSLMDIQEDDRIEVSYRFVPKGQNSVIRSTLKVTSRFGDEDEGESYSQGPDYAVNINQGKITRIPQGDIIPQQGDLAVYVDFYYKENPTDLHTYSTWVFQPSLEPIKIEYSNIGLDLDIGEKFVINSPNFTTDLSNSTETPFLSRGWHQIIVKSRDPEVFTTAGINRVIEMRDIDGDYIFVRGGKYFNEMQAIRSAMTEVTYGYLKNSVLKANHSHFAIKDKSIVVNFKPGSTEDFYTYRALVDNEGVVTGFSTQNTEDFVLNYNYSLPDQVTADSLLVKIGLSKLENTDGGITPKVFSYNARIK